MKTNQKFLLVLAIVTLAFVMITLLYLDPGIIIQFNTSESGTSELSKYLVILVILSITAFIGFQLYDQKNQGDYTRWYISTVIIIAIEIWIIIVNT